MSIRCVKKILRTCLAVATLTAGNAHAQVSGTITSPTYGVTYT